MKPNSFLARLTASALAAALIIPPLALTGCSSSDVEAALPEIQLAAQGGTAFAITELKLKPADIADIVNIGGAINSLTAGNSAPTVAQLQSAISKYVSTPGSQAVGSLVTALYQQYYPKVSGNGQVALDLLHAISAGVVAGAGGTTPAATAAAKPYRGYIIVLLYEQRQAQAARPRPTTEPHPIPSETDDATPEDSKEGAPGG